MKRIILNICSIVVMSAISCVSVSAQKIEIKPQAVGLDDVVTVLSEQLGYRMFSFDLSELSKEDYVISFYAQEVTKHKAAEPQMIEICNSRIVFSDNSQSFVRKLLITLANHNDSTSIIKVKFEGTHGNIFGISNRVPLKPIKTASMTLYSYSERPFELKQMELGKLIPLVMYGSSWWAPSVGPEMVAFCGVDDPLDPNIMKDADACAVKEGDDGCGFAYIPHYYVFGIKVEKMKK